MTFSPTFGYFDVTDPAYAGGAKGNGTTDDAPAIQAAELACEAAHANGYKGGVVYFPPGTYLVKSTTEIKVSGVQWRGAGNGASQILSYTGTLTAPTVVKIDTGVSYVTISDLGFVGNGVAPMNGAQPAADAMQFGASGTSGGVNCKVLNCYFTNNTGATVTFYGIVDAEVSGCRFYNVGYHYPSTYFGDAYITPAVYVEDMNCADIRIHHNRFESCQYDGVRIKGSRSEVSFNYFFECYDTAIFVGGNGTNGFDMRITNNFVDATKTVANNANQGIYIQEVENFQVIGNTVRYTDNDGIAGGGCSNGVYIGNIVYDNCQKISQSGSGDCGIQYISQTGTESENTSIAFIGNVCYDNQSMKTQKYGFHFLTQTGKANLGFTLIGNTFWGNTGQDIFVGQMTLQDDSNAIIGNTQDWIDRQHRTSTTLTGSTSKSSLLGSDFRLGPGSMLQTHGVRFVASGSTTGSGNKSFYLGLSTSGNLMTVTGQSGAAPWQLVAYILDNGDQLDQRSMIQFWFDGALVYSTPAATTIDLSVHEPIMLEGKLAVSGDSITCDFASVERI